MKIFAKIFVISILSFLVFACSTKNPARSFMVNSPLGLYKSNTEQKFWLAIMTEGNYSLCSPKSCYHGKYQKVPVNYGVILVDFYISDIGQTIERLSHGRGETAEFYAAMKNLRLTEPRANDLAFNISDCKGIPCVGLGHTRAGVKFYKIEEFDLFWRA